MNPVLRFALSLWLWSAAHGQMDMPRISRDRDTNGIKHGDENHAKFRARLTTKPPRVKSQASTQLTIHVTDAKGKATRDFEVVHTKLIHLVVVSKDLSSFAHIHPVLKNGKFTIAHSFPFGGPFRLFADFTPKGKTEQVVPVDVNVEGALHRSVALAVDARPTKVFGKYLVTLSSKPGRLRAGREAMLTFSVAYAATKRPVEKFEDYLGARGHCVIVGEGAQQFIHSHPMEDMPMAHGKGPASSKMPAKGTDIKSQVMFHTTFPRRGLYKVWAQMMRQGKVFVADYIVKVE